MKADPKKNIPQQNSNPEVWQNWHSSLKDNYGKKSANAIFLYAWSIRGNKNDDANLRAYLKENGITLTTGVLGKTEDYASGIVDSIGDIFSVGKYFGIGIVVLGVGLTTILIYNIVKDPIKSANAAKGFKTL